MPTPVKKNERKKKAVQDNKKDDKNDKRKPTAQELHQQDFKKPAPVNPTNAADPSSTAGGPLNTRPGYSLPDSPGENENQTVNALPGMSVTGGDREIPAPPHEDPSPVKDNPRMRSEIV